jgi:hypothetical protein
VLQDLKAELNAQFRGTSLALLQSQRCVAAKHDRLPPSLTLSKIRKIKQLMLQLGQSLVGHELNLLSSLVGLLQSPSLELSTVALAYVYFEKIAIRVSGVAIRRVTRVFQGVVTKDNRRLVAAVCMLLAFKFNEVTQRVLVVPKARLMAGCCSCQEEEADARLV